MEDLDVPGRQSMQFESDLKKYKDLSFQTRRVQRHHVLSAKPQQSPPPSPLTFPSSRDHSPTTPSQPSANGCNSNFIAFSGNTPTARERVSEMANGVV